MKREILFRGLRIDGKGLVYGYYMKASNSKEVHHIIFEVGNSVESNPIEVIPESVGQFTGLTDKNGTKIFEGDIVVFDSEDGRVTAKVIFGNSEDENLNISVFRFEVLTVEDWEDDEAVDIKVIGNIHEN